MKFFIRFLALAALIVFASVVSTLSINVSGRDLNVATRDVKVFEYTGGTEVMAPHDVELLRRIPGWTYRASTFICILLLSHTRVLTSVRTDEKLFALVIVKNACATFHSLHTGRVTY